MLGSDHNHDNGSLRISELRETLFRLNDAMKHRLGCLDQLETILVDRLITGQLSLNAKAVEAYKLADRIFAKSLRMNIRIYQRNILYFNLRKRQLQDKLASFGVNAEDLDREWLARSQSPLERKEQPSEEPPDNPPSDL